MEKWKIWNTDVKKGREGYIQVGGETLVEAIKNNPDILYYMIANRKRGREKVKEVKEIKTEYRRYAGEKRGKTYVKITYVATTNYSKDSEYYKEYVTECECSVFTDENGEPDGRRWAMYAGGRWTVRED